MIKVKADAIDRLMVIKEKVSQYPNNVGNITITNDGKKTREIYVSARGFSKQFLNDSEILKATQFDKFKYKNKLSVESLKNEFISIIDTYIKEIKNTDHFDRTIDSSLEIPKYLTQYINKLSFKIPNHEIENYLKELHRDKENELCNDLINHLSFYGDY